MMEELGITQLGVTNASCCSLYLAPARDTTNLRDPFYAARSEEREKNQRVGNDVALTSSFSFESHFVRHNPTQAAESSTTKKRFSFINETENTTPLHSFIIIWTKPQRSEFNFTVQFIVCPFAVITADESASYTSFVNAESICDCESKDSIRSALN